MNAFYKYKDQKGQHSISPTLLWDYDLDNFDWLKNRGEVIKRVIMLGRLSDFFAAFDMYGGIDAVGQIAKNEVNDLSERDLDFMCRAFNLKKEDTLCYRNIQSRIQLLSS